jgi:threonylcarbamoyladenosine tRNA methylthiotransferase MtaB
MARPIDPERYRALVFKIRALFPGIAITSDLMVGFPGESDTEFGQSLEFVGEMGFANAHVFTYSARPGTAAAELPGQVPGTVMRERSERMRQAVVRSAMAYSNAVIGSTLEVLWESATPRHDGEWDHAGHSDNYLWVSARAGQNLWNQISVVNVEHVTDRGVGGRVVRSA